MIWEEVKMNKKYDWPIRILAVSIILLSLCSVMQSFKISDIRSENKKWQEQINEILLNNTDNADNDSTNTVEVILKNK